MSYSRRTYTILGVPLRDSALVNNSLNESVDNTKVYKWSTGALYAPCPYGIMITLSRAGRHRQFVFDTMSASNIYTRGYFNDEWTNWSQIAMTA